MRIVVHGQQAYQPGEGLAALIGRRLLDLVEHVPDHRVLGQEQQDLELPNGLDLSCDEVPNLGWHARLSHGHEFMPRAGQSAS